MNRRGLFKFGAALLAAPLAAKLPAPVAAAPETIFTFTSVGSRADDYTFAGRLIAMQVQYADVMPHYDYPHPKELSREFHGNISFHVDDDARQQLIDVLKAYQENQVRGPLDQLFEAGREEYLAGETTNLRDLNWDDFTSYVG